MISKKSVFFALFSLFSLSLQSTPLPRTSSVLSQGCRFIHQVTAYVAPPSALRAQNKRAFLSPGSPQFGWEVAGLALAGVFLLLCLFLISFQKRVAREHDIYEKVQRIEREKGTMQGIDLPPTMRPDGA